MAAVVARAFLDLSAALVHIHWVVWVSLGSSLASNTEVASLLVITGCADSKVTGVQGLVESRPSRSRLCGTGPLASLHVLLLGAGGVRDNARRFNS